MDERVGLRHFHVARSKVGMELFDSVLLAIPACCTLVRYYAAMKARECLIIEEVPDHGDDGYEASARLRIVCCCASCTLSFILRVTIPRHDHHSLVEGSIDALGS